MTDINGDLFERRPHRCLFFFPLHHILAYIKILLFALLLLPSVASWAQDDSVLQKKFSLSSPFYGSRDSLIYLISSQTSTDIAFSSRVLQPGNISLKAGNHSIKSALDAIFSRFKVRYICTPNKIVVSPEEIKIFTINGYCRDALSHDILIGAHVSDTAMHRASHTNEYGFFSLSVPSGTVPLRLSFVGYTPYFRSLNLTSDTLIDVALHPHLLLSEVDIVAEEHNPMDESSSGTVALPMEQVKNMPALLGETDLTRALLQTPGVQSGNEGYGGMSVRGAGQDQNLIYLDDAPLYNPSHMLGFFTVFNSDIINEATLIKSGFPARYGGRIGSVLDVKTHDGNMEQFSGNANIGLLASTLKVEGPIKQDSSSIILSARRTYLDLIFYHIQRNNENTYAYLFYDLHFKFNRTLSPKDRLYATVFYTKDKLTNGTNQEDVDINYGNDESLKASLDDETSTSWNTFLSSARWNHVFTPKLFSNLTLWYSNYRFSNRQTTKNNTAQSLSNNLTNEYRNGIHDLGARIDFSLYPTNTAIGRFRFGASLNYKIYEPLLSIRSTSVADTTTNGSVRRDIKLHRLEGHTYIEHRLSAHRFFSTTGLHLSFLNRSGRKPYVQLEPRAIAGVNVNNSLLFKLCYSLISQFTYQMRTFSVSTPADMWLPISNNSTPQLSSQLSLETEWKITPNATLTVEAYNKWMPHLTTYRTMSTYELLNTMQWNDIGIEGKGYARGLELFLHVKRGKIAGWAGYSIAKARNKFNELNDGNYFPTDNDRLHSVNIFVSYNVKPDLNISATWEYGTGLPLTLASQRYTLPGSNATFSVPTNRNNMRMANAHQLNIGVTKQFDQNRRGNSLSFGIYNVYAKRNPSFIYWKNENNTYKLKEFCFMAYPWPYIKYSISF